MHHTENGFVNANWFYEIVPELEKFSYRPFSEEFNNHFNQLYEKKYPNRGMNPTQVRAVNLFFKKFVPGVEGVCTKCYKIMLPRSGAGEKYLYPQCP
jgi:hypothetical protein